MKPKLLLPLFTATVFATAALAGGATDEFTPAAPGSVRLEGWRGDKLAWSLANRVMAQDLERIIKAFRDRTEEDGGHWRCEYWGKWFTSAAWGCACEPTPEHRAVIDRGVKELLATQTPDDYVALMPSASKPANVWMAFDVPFEVRPSHYFNHRQVTLAMCDYASAGNGWSSDNLFRAWLPQPLFLRNAYPADTWRIMCPDLKECPPIPTATSAISKNGKQNSPQAKAKSSN